ncbi:hypothetical protein BDN72DRAFT_391440 [Pluteus cervinus]|uniref:Uncharacterized protein n=1 Tax=Pluteus cervinus TaxID=181527 RepID=A0ACD3AAM7_9AGAR|nr:hypothetical protein BDN72DRAFT_391440 [Pluteus cervinus]
MGGRQKRRLDGKLKPPSDLTISTNLDYGHRMTIPQAPLQNVGLPSGSTNPGFPLSHDRPLRSGSNPGLPANKKPRLVPSISSHSRSPSDDNGLTPVGQSNGAYGYHSNGSYRQPQQQQSQYPSFFPTHSTPPQPPFLPLQPDLFPLSSPRGGPTSGMGRSGSTGNLTYGGRGSYDQGMYQLVRQPTHNNHRPSHHSNSAELFPFLDVERSQPSHNNNYSSLDWPVHSSSQPSVPSVPSSGTHISCFY